MFLDSLVTKNRPFVEAAVQLHQEGAIPANSYVLDLDTMRANAAVIAGEARRQGLTVLAMTKQFGRNGPAIAALAEGGIDRFVAVDMPCARAIRDSGHQVAHIGHLSQVARHEAVEAARLGAEHWTVFNAEKAAEAAAAAEAIGRTQELLARIVAPGDRFYNGHEGGFDAAEVEAVADLLDSRKGGRFAGLTTFPALLYDETRREVVSTPNLTTLSRAAERLARQGRTGIALNAPGTTSAVLLQVLAAAGATHVEPGHGLTGTTALHVVKDLPERPAILYLTEVSHRHAGDAFALAGGLYVDPIFPAYQEWALVGPDPDAALSNRVRATIPDPASIDYYGKLHPEAGQRAGVGDTVLYGFRPQVFVTRAYVVPIAGVDSGRPEAKGVWNAEGRLAVFG
jgi:predicted amino acid racemase